jgi:exopolyphosphatase/guanosine-5'-triphosphate,3'-diphosphate pyrophosphatase
MVELSPATAAGKAAIDGGDGDLDAERSAGPLGPFASLPSAGEAAANDGPGDAGGASASGDDRRSGWDRAAALRPGALARQAYAAIDLGTNNCRLLIARPAGENFTVIDAFSRVVRLGEGLSQTGSLSREAMDRALGALHVCADKLRRRGVHLARSVATEACRRAANGAEFIERVHAETGIRLDIISAQEEARLAVLGCHILLERGEGPAMIFDIGGGSTELVLVETDARVPRIVDWQSVPWGVVSLTESCGGGAGESDDDAGALAGAYARMRRQVAASFADFARRIGPHKVGSLRLLGTSGTVTTLASLHLELAQYDRRAVDGLIVPAEAMRTISARLSAMSLDERRQLPCIGRERAELVVAGCAILETILDLWPADRLGVADRGIREGILRGLMAAGDVAARSRAALRRMGGRPG